MKTRKICAIILAGFLLPATALATSTEPVETEQNTIIFRYQDLQDALAQFSVQGTTGTYTLKATGNSAITKITATLQIQKQGSTGTYANYGTSWSASSNSRTLYTTGTKAVVSGGTYRLKATINLYTGSTYSTETIYS